jgi:putative oxidoreductase
MNSITQLYQRLHAVLTLVADLIRSPLLLIVRLYFFWQLFQDGLGKMSNIAKVAEYFGSLGIPLPVLNARINCGVETFGSLLLIFGLATRPVALVVAFVMTVAYVAGDRAAVLQVFSDPDQFVKAAPFPFFVTALILFFAGPGWISVDAWLGRVFGKKTE